MNNQRLQPMQPNETNGSSRKNNDDVTIANFGWEQIKNGPLLPFIKKESKDYVPRYIVVEKVFKIILSMFSPQMLYCIPLRTTPMGICEARAFNEINIRHCDKGLAGNHVFTDGELMLPLEDVRKVVEFFQACRNSMFCGLKHNNLFGFIRVNDETEIPFIWEGTQKLVPLFYFEGIDATVVTLKDPWKLGYFKFCFKVQKIRQDLYKGNLQVINFEQTQKLFPVRSTFELCWSKSVHQDLINPEMQAKLRLSESQSMNPHSVIHGNQPGMLGPATTGSINCLDGNTHTQPTGLECTRSDQNLATIHLVPPAGSIRSDGISQNFREPREVTYQQPSLEISLQGSTNYTATKKLQQLASGSLTVSTVPNMHHRFYTNRSVEEELITNVPRRSPQVATSPGVQQTSPFLMAATEPIQRYAQSNNGMSSGSLSNPVQQTYMSHQIYPPQQSYMHQGQCVNQFNHQWNGNNNVKHLDRSPAIMHNSGHIQQQHLVQPSCGYQPLRRNNKNLSKRKTISDKNSRLVGSSSKTSKAGPFGSQCVAESDSSQDQFLHRGNVPAINKHLYSATQIGHPKEPITISRPNEDRSFTDPLDARLHPSPSQLSQFRNNHSNYSSLGAQEANSSTSLSQGEAPVTLTADSIEAHIQQLAHEQSMLTENLMRNKKNLRLLKQKKSRQHQTKVHLQQNSEAKNHNLSANNNQFHGHFLPPVSTELQSISSSQPESYREEYEHTILPVAQNAVTNVLVSDRNGNNNDRLESTTSVISNKNCKANKIQLIFLIPDHVLNVDTYKETYIIKKMELKKQQILGIQMSLLTNDFLINFREFVAKINEPNVTTIPTQYKLAARFKVLYKLNHVQKVLWNEWSKGRTFLANGFLHDVFVEHKEAVSVLGNLVCTPLL